MRAHDAVEHGARGIARRVVDRRKGHGAGARRCRASRQRKRIQDVSKTRLPRTSTMAYAETAQVAVPAHLPPARGGQYEEMEDRTPQARVVGGRPSGPSGAAVRSGA